MDKAIQAIAALGVPGLILLVTMGIVGWTGAAAITAALAVLGGPFGMLGGVALLGVMVMISGAITRYGLQNLALGVINEMKARGRTKADILEEMKKYPLSGDLKRKLIEYLNSLPGDRSPG